MDETKTSRFTQRLDSYCFKFLQREDWEFLVRNEALPEERMRAVETGGCPHAAIREV